MPLNPRLCHATLWHSDLLEFTLSGEHGVLFTKVPPEPVHQAHVKALGLIDPSDVTRAATISNNTDAEDQSSTTARGVLEIT